MTPKYSPAGPKGSARPGGPSTHAKPIPGRPIDRKNRLPLFAAAARKQWPRADAIVGDGCWATVIECDPAATEIWLFSSPREAADAAEWDCCGWCCGRHRVELLEEA